MAHALPHSFSQVIYPASQASPHFLSQYYPSHHHHQQPQGPFSHLAHGYPDRINLKAERRRPKYTRSKNGCLTCRKKKVKCDEAKPKCTRCVNSSGECLWPPMSSKKKPQQRRKASPTEGSIDRSSFSSTPSNDQDASHTNINGSTVEANGETNGHQVSPAQLSEQNLVKAPSSDSDRCESAPQLQVPLPSRRHSMGDVINSQLEQQQQQFGSSNGACDGGALGLTQVPQLNGTNFRASAEFAYPQSAPHSGMYQHHHYSPASAPQVLSNGGSPYAYGSSRPSTAGSLVLNRRPSSSSRPSTSGSMPSAHFVHRPPSSGSGSQSGDAGTAPYPAANMMFSLNNGNHYQHQRQRASLDLSNGSAPVSVASFSSSSRPSTAGSVAPSPFMRNGMHVGVGSGGAEGPNGERWAPPNPSPLMHSVALSQQQAEAVYAASMHSTPQNSRPHTPWN